jgi:peroxiredoxin Q/BCP
MAPRLEPGDAAPDFTLTDAAGSETSLASLRGQRVILFAYPAAFTPGCTREACDFRDSIPALQAAGYTVVGISPDDPETLDRFATEHELTYPLLSDPSRETLTAYGAFGEKKNYGKTVMGVIRSTFVIDPEGTIALAKYGVKSTGHVARLRKDLGLDS